MKKSTITYVAIILGLIIVLILGIALINLLLPARDIESCINMTLEEFLDWLVVTYWDALMVGRWIGYVSVGIVSSLIAGILFATVPKERKEN